MRDVDIIALLVYIVSLLVYLAFSYYTLRREELQTYRTKISQYRAEWLRRQLKENRYDNVLNTVRNSLVAASSLASALIIMVGFIINKVVPDGERTFFEYFTTNKLSLINIMLFLTIYFLFMHIRLLSRFTFLAGTDLSIIKKVEGEEGLAYLSSMLNRTMNQFSYAMRCLYYAVVAVLWLFDTHLFIIATILLTVVLIYRESFAKVEFV